MQNDNIKPHKIKGGVWEKTELTAVDVQLWLGKGASNSKKVEMNLLLKLTSHGWQIWHKHDITIHLFAWICIFWGSYLFLQTVLYLVIIYT